MTPHRPQYHHFDRLLLPGHFLIYIFNTCKTNYLIETFDTVSGQHVAQLENRKTLQTGKRHRQQHFGFLRRRDSLIIIKFNVNWQLAANY